MTLTVRSATVTGATTKGSPLTHAELDENFNHLSQSSNHSFTQSGTGATAETVQSRGRWFGYVTDYLSDANRASIRAGSTVDIATALTNCLAEHAVALVPPYNDYTLGSKVTVPANKGIVGFNKTNTTITKAFNGDMIDLSAAGAFIEGIDLEGDGANFTGKGVVLATAGAGKQRVHHCKINDTAGACIAFDSETAGSQFSGFDLELSRTSSGTGTGNYAVTVTSTNSASANPRKFSHVETQGNCSFDFGGCNDFMVSDSFIGDIAFHANSTGVHISNTRLANQSALTIQGDNHTVVGCGLAPDITLSGVGPFTLQGNTYNGTVTDSSNNPNDNLVDAPSVAYTPVWTAASVNPAIGDGTIAGWYSRQGNIITATIAVSMGSTTTFGTGEYSFSLPVATTVTGRNFTGSVQALDLLTAYRAGSCLLAPGVDTDTVKCFGDGGGTAYSPTVPHTWADGDTLNITITYIV